MANEENKTLNKKSTLLNSNHKRKYKNYDPLIWTLDQNPITNAKLLSDKYLKYTIEKGIDILVSLRLYVAGIRNKKAFCYWFDSIRKESSILKIFPNYDFENNMVVKFRFFSHRTTKWARKCGEHAKFVEDNVFQCALEYMRRHNKSYPSQNFIEYLCVINPISKQMPLGKMKKLIPEWKNIPPKYRCNDVYMAFKRFYKSKIEDPFEEYKFSKTDIPEFLISNNTILV